nr:hypothetical protein [uncultured Celeribacter sp.]
MSKQPFDTLPLPQQAGIMCNDPRFQQFAAIRCGFPGGQFSSEAAAEYVRDICKINSRRQLAHNPEAETRFQSLRTDFDAWTGKIAKQR